VLLTGQVCIAAVRRYVQPRDVSCQKGSSVIRLDLLPALAALALLLGGCDAAVTAPVGVAEALPAPQAPAGDFDGLLNRARVGAGLPAAEADPRLMSAAQTFAADMAARGYFAHTSPDGGALPSRLAAVGFAQCGAAESIAFGHTSPTGAYGSWMASPPHRANLLLPGAARYGVGQAGDRSVLIVARPC